MTYVRKNTQWYSWGIKLVLLGGAALAVFGFFVLREAERLDVRSVFMREMDNRYASLERELDLHKEFLLGLKGFFDASEYVSRHEFNEYVNPALPRIEGLQAVEWIPYVSKRERLAFEKKAQASGFPDFIFTQRTEQNRMVPVEERDAYYPVYYVVPLKGNETALGFDLGSSPTRLQTLKQARDLATSVVSPRILLIQKGNQAGVLQLVAVYEGEPTTVDERRKALKGFVLGVHRIGDIVDYSLMKINIEDIGIDFCLVDRTAPEGEGVLYESKSWAGIPQSKDFYFEKELKFGGRKWMYIATPTQEFLRYHKSFKSYGVLASGLIITLLLTLYIRQGSSDLRDTQGTTQAIVASSLHCILMIDSVGKVLLFNPAAEKVFGYSSKEVVGNNVTMLMPDPYRSNHPQFLKNYLGTGLKKIIGIGREVRALKKDNTEFPIFLSVSEIAGAQGGRRFVGMIVDITKRKQDEEMLIKAKDEAESANRTKSEFLNVMSHELRTPLTVILGYLPILMNKDKIPEAQMVAQIASEMDHSGHHLLTLINDLLDISKIEAGALDLDCQSLSISDSVEDVADMFRNKIEEKGLEIECRTIDALVFADQIRIRQVLINLLGNAVKFTDKGKITIEVELGGRTVLVSVTDTGAGIGEEDLMQVFEMFRQADSTASRSAEGTGLGLAITRRLVEMHGGEIYVDSILGEGSTFTFSLPVYNG
ncbi:MAG: CHASE domain-containing protein [Pseudodesulfovibrio sp.]|nr:CHASE domain-containing protein [Pseudodesulfovibrio sp.]